MSVHIAESAVAAATTATARLSLV